MVQEMAEALRIAQRRRGSVTHEHPAPSRRDIIWNVYVGDMVFKNGEWWWVIDIEPLGQDDDATMFVLLQSSDPSRSSVTDSAIIRWDQRVRVRRYSQPQSKW